MDQVISLLESSLPLSRQANSYPCRFAWFCAAFAALLFLTLVIGFSLTRCPWWDEGLFADVAVNFAKHGHLRSSLLAPYAFADLPDVNHYTYWQLPSYLVGLGIWFCGFPVSVLSMRAFSIFWGAVFGLSWFLFVRAISRDTTLSLLVASVVLFDSSSIAASSNGRMDMMCAALGLAALAACVSIRMSDIRIAAFVAGLLAATSLLCHPMGAVTNAMFFALIVSDRRKLGWSGFAILRAPYIVLGAFYVHYIALAPAIYVAQMKGVSGYRLGGALSLLQNIASDFQDRYLHYYFAPHSGFHKLKSFSLLFGLTGLFALVGDRRYRSSALFKLLLTFASIGFLGVAALDDQKFPYYLIYVTPILSACGGLWLYECLSDGRKARWVAFTLFVAYILSTIAGTSYYIHRNDFKYEYDPMVASVKRYTKAGDIIMGPSEL